MRRLVKGRAIAFLLLLLLCPVLYLLAPRSSRIIKPTPSYPQSTRQSRAHPIYEYTSLYRQHANKAFESYLDSTLRSLEVITTGVADLAIHQITTPDLAAKYKPWSEQWQKNNKGWHKWLSLVERTSWASEARRQKSQAKGRKCPMGWRRIHVEAGWDGLVQKNEEL